MFGVWSYVALAVLALGFLTWGGLSVKGCIEAKHQVKVLEKMQEKTAEVKEADERSKEEIGRMPVDEFVEFMRNGGRVRKEGGVRPPASK